MIDYYDDVVVLKEEERRTGKKKFLPIRVVGIANPISMTFDHSKRSLNKIVALNTAVTHNGNNFGINHISLFL